jgi:hypothetical protein
MEIYLVGVVIAWIGIFTIVVSVILEKKPKKAPLDILDITVVSLFSWLIIVGLIIAAIMFELKDKKEKNDRNN